MAVAHNNPRRSVEEFFALRQSDPAHRYEYIDGHIYMMSGGTPRHAIIGANLNGLLWDLLRGKPCRVYNSDACVQVSEERYVCPDVTVSCDSRDGDEDEEEDEMKTLHYPSVVMEVLSAGTKAYDRGAKFELYQDVTSIQEYVVIETRLPRVLLYRREQNNLWTIHILHPGEDVELTSIGVKFPVAAIYEKTRFSKEEQP
ncbi:MAG TPA: Uma2 family endonuclease [Ktedonosporobacter sp.]|nr:Uma2 family endonuclease [Ktedonosporobacter sp.]